jgi:hypothetical protein
VKKLRVVPKLIKPIPSKILHVDFIVSIGKDDTRTMQEMVNHIRENIVGWNGVMPIATPVWQSSEYQYEGKRYSVEDWDNWNGDLAFMPRPLYGPESWNPEKKINVTNQMHKGAQTISDVAEALAGIPRVTKRTPKKPPTKKLKKVVVRKTISPK